MPDITSYNGIDMADIASINGQDIASGGAFNPVTGAGTYTETVPTSGLIQIGGSGFSSYDIAQASGKASGQDYLPGFIFGADIKRNFSSDVDGSRSIASTPFSGTVAAMSSHGGGVMIVDTEGKLWIMSKDTNLWGVGGSATRRGFTQLTGVGASDTGWTKVGCGQSHAFAINSGKLYAIGSGSYGKLGRGSTSSSYNSWIQIGSDSDWVDVKATANHSVAIKGSSNTLYTCGSNADGKTGHGTTSSNTTTWTAVTATNLLSSSANGFSYITASYHHTGGIQSGRAFMCGKSSSSCPFGQNITVDQDVMIQVGSVGGSLQTDWTQLAPTYYSTNFLNSSGHLYHQGSYQYYLSGDGTTTNHKDQAVRTGTFSDATDLIISHLEYSPSRAGVVRGGKPYYAGQSKQGNIVPTSTSATSAYAKSWTLILDAQINGNSVFIYPSSATNQMSFMAQFQ